MTKAQITNPKGYKCAPEGHTTERFEFGAVVGGTVADWAIASGNAEEIKEEIPAEFETTLDLRGYTKVQLISLAEKRGITINERDRVEEIRATILADIEDELAEDSDDEGADE